MKPIEPGCLAITVNCKIPKNNGKTVRVGKWLGRIRGFRPGPQWETDAMILTTFGRKVSHIHERNLMLIDGYDPAQDEVDSEELTLIKS